uniref:Uncharacterized protein n=1 Tax=Setaria italica TaxID=4555 RepID=K4APE7_SETIT
MHEPKGREQFGPGHGHNCLHQCTAAPNKPFQVSSESYCRQF